MRMQKFVTAALLAAGVGWGLGASGCGGGGGGETQADVVSDAGPSATDAGATDAGATDAGGTDTGAPDTGGTDTGGTDTGATDTGPQCPADACAIGQRSCSSDDAAVVECVDDGTGCGVEESTDCGAGKVCDATSVQCVDEGCPAGSCAAIGTTYCDPTGARLLTCTDDDGDGCGTESLSEDCASGVCQDGACTVPCPDPPACADGDRRCAADAAGVEVCGTTDGCPAWVADQPCALGEVCLGDGAAAACEVATLELRPLGTDILIVGQKLPLAAQVRHGDGTVELLASGDVTWELPDQDLAEVITEQDTDLLHGLKLGAGGQYAPDGTLWIQATYGPLTSAQVPFQVVGLREGTGIYPEGPAPQTEDPDTGVPAPPGPARYDGLYVLDSDAVGWYCNEATTCPSGGTCDPERHACVDSSGKLVEKMGACDWNAEPCAPHEADVRLFVGERMELGLLVDAKYGAFDYGELIEAPPADWAGPGDPPKVARPLHIDWEVVPGEATDVVDIDDVTGAIMALKPGRTAITAWLGLQGVTFEVVAYDVRGYVPSEDYAPGVTFEDGHLVLFSSSHGPAAAGTHDTVRVVDLSDYHEQDRRPSKYGPQGLRLKENGDELFGGGGCGMIQGADGEVFLLNGRIALSLDTTTMTQGRGGHQVNFHTTGVPNYNQKAWGFQVCQGAYWQAPSGNEYLFGAEMAGKDKGPVRLWWVEITDLAQGDVDAVPVTTDYDVPFVPNTDTTLFQPTVWTDDSGQAWLLGVSAGVDYGGVQSDLNYLHFLPMEENAAGYFELGTLVAPAPSFDIQASIPAALPADLSAGWMAHPGLAVAPFHDGRDLAFIGNDESITVVDLQAHAVLSYADVNPGSDTYAKDGMETRWYGWGIKGFALSPDGTRLYALPYSASPQTPLYCDGDTDCDFTGDQTWVCSTTHECLAPNNDVYNVVYPGKTVIDYRSWNGAYKQTDLTTQRVAVIDLSAAAGERPAFDTTLWSCYREDDALGTDYCQGLPHRKPGIDLRQIAYKKFFLDHGFTASTGALPAVLNLNIRQMAASEESLFLIGADYADGLGSALANLTDLAVFRVKPGADGHTAHGVIFRGYRGDGYGLQGLSDAFGFRLGDRDAELGQARVKNAAILYLPGAPPADKPGDGPPVQDDEPLPPSDHYANAPALPGDDAGHLLVVASDPDTTMGVMRDIDLATHTEADADPSAQGAQGVQLVEATPTGDANLEGACGMVRGKGDVVWIFTGTTAVPFDAQTMTQLYGGHYISWPGDSGIRFCTGAYWDNGGGLEVLYGLDTSAKPVAPVALANVGDLAAGNVDALAVIHGTGTYLAPYMIGSDTFNPRYVQAEVLGNTLYVLEKNEARSKFRNIVHRFPITTGTGGVTPQPDGDLWGEYTAEPLYQWGDPGMFLADFPAGAADATRHLFIGNQNSVTVYDLGDAPTATSAATRLSYNLDGDGIQDDLDTTLFGRSMAAFALSPDGTRLFGLPYVKSGRLPVDKILVPSVDGGTRAQGVDRYRVAVLDLTDTQGTGRPEVDISINHGNGIDLVYRYMKQQIVSDGVSPGMLPPLFYTVRRQLAVSQRSLFILGFDNVDGTGSALSLVNDIGMFDIATGQGYILGPTGDVGYPASAAPWGFQLGVDADGLKAEGMPRGLVGGALWVPSF